MTIQRKLAPAYEVDIANAIADRDTTVDTTIGPVRDFVAYPVSRVADSLNADTVHLSEILSLKNVDQFTVAELDDVAYNDQILRGTGSFATTIVTLLSSSPPTANVVIPINFPFSTDPDPQSGQVIFFRATQTVTYTASVANSYYDAALRMYKLEIPVEAVAIGTFSNVGPGRIIRAQRSIGGFQRVVNYASATGGTDQESNASLAETLLIFALGINDISTPFGIELETRRQFPQVSDTAVVFGSDPLLTRASADSGATDLYIIGADAESFSESFVYVGQDLVLSKQPVLSIASVTSGATTYVQDVNFTFVADTGPYGGSVRGSDAVAFIPSSPLLPALGATVTVTYAYNELVSTLQNFFSSDQFQVIGRDLLYKQGQIVPVAVAGTLYVLPGFDPNTVRANVVAAITTYVNSLQLGESLEEFDLLAYIGTVLGSPGGVDNLVLTLLNQAGLTGVVDIVPGKPQYCRISVPNLNITIA